MSTQPINFTLDWARQFHYIDQLPQNIQQMQVNHRSWSFIYEAESIKRFLNNDGCLAFQDDFVLKGLKADN